MAEFTETKTIQIDCPACHSTRIVKVGKRNGQQRYLCRECSKKFRANGMPEGRRVSAEQMGMAVRMFYKQIGETVADAFDIPEPSKSTIYEWVKEYTDKAVKEMENHPAQVGDTWVADEMMVRVGGQKYWNWNLADEKTRYILASYLSKDRDTRAAKAMLRRSKARSAVTPKEIKTDKWRAYIKAIKDVFPDTKHVQSEGLRAELNNNMSERLQGTFRQREKTLRGLDSRETGQRYLDGWVLTYNLFREHESLDGQTPGEEARLKPTFTEWADVVRESGGVVEPRIAVTGAKPPKVEKAPPQIVVADIQPMSQPDPPTREKGRNIRVAAPRSPVRRAPRMFQSAAAKGRTPKGPAWLRRGEVKGRY